MKDRKNLILLIIFLAFFAIMLPMVSIPVDIGEHTCTGAIYDWETWEKVEAVTVTLSGKRIYSLGNSRDYNCEFSILIQAESFEMDIPLNLRNSESLGGLTYCFYPAGSGTRQWGNYSPTPDFAFREKYTAIIKPLQADGKTLYLSAVEDPAKQSSQDALTDFLTAMGWQ